MTISAGTYRAKAISSGIGVSNTKSTPYVRVTLAILAGAQEGQEIDWIAYVTDKTQERVAEDLRTLGYTGNDPEELHDRNEQDVSQLLPNVVSIVVEEEEWKGEVRTRVRWINPEKKESGGTSLFSGMKAAFAQLDQKNGGGGKKPAGGAIPRPAPPAEVSDDEVPF